jgi:predicted ATP-grasp superfamily ATP-dependent carboligase
MRALILSSSNVRGGIGGARRLRQAGWTVFVGTSDPTGPLAWTRAVEVVHPIVPPERDLEAFLTGVEQAVRASRAEVVFPSGDAELLALSQGRDRISAVVPLVDDGTVRRLVDKLELVNAALAAGLDAPVTVPADEAGYASMSYPVIVKSRFHWLPGYAAGAPSRLDATVCATEEEARRRVLEMESAGAQVVLQELISGTHVNLHGVSDQLGTLLGVTQQESPPMFFPPGAGLRIRSVVVPLDPVLESGARRLLAESRWFGFAGITFVRGADGRYRVIDFNGRIPAHLEAAAAAGPNYLAVWAALATGRTPPPLLEPKLGQRNHWLEGDLRRALRERRGGLLRDVASALIYSVGASHSVLKRDDPLLGLRYTARQIRASRFITRPPRD